MNGRYIARRLGNAAITLLLATIAVFLLLRLAPGDPARLMLGEQATQEQVADLRHSLGLDEPLTSQYFDFLGGLLQGDLGTSLRGDRSVQSLIEDALPHTLLLVGAATLVAVLVGLPLGVMSAFRPRAFGWAAQIGSLFGQAVPAFWIGVMAIALFAVHWQWFPTSGYGGIDHLVLPTLALAPFLMAVVIRVSRQSVLDVMHEDYVRTAYAKGLHLHTVVYPHMLKNALPPVLTVVSLYAAGMVGGAVPVEVVFAWPGIGQLAVNAVVARDYPVIQGVVLVSAFIFILVNLLVDVSYLALDPRTRLE